ncbi:MAG: AIR carboxylase family protein [Candidatus Omnitrophica bacterium]|nr:AIR carboxylase family protein [Candidatus Omnitrophota bacterium]MCM8831647.1 AIR carboxylase family protein [Candidatus Omnitrophota bacterium]
MKEKIAIVLGSKSDYEKLKEHFNIFSQLDIPYRMEIISAHRHPDKLRDFCKKIEKEGVLVVIACAGLSAALPAVIASYVNIPVIGVAMKGGILDGLDALLSITSIPKGLGLVCSGVGESAFVNAIIFSLNIISFTDKTYLEKLKQLKEKFK